MRRTLRRFSFLMPVLVVIVVLVVNYFVALPYFVLGPGTANPVNSAITIAPDHQVATKGKVLFTTVSFVQAHPLDIVATQFRSDDQVEKQRTAIGDSTPQQFLQANEVSMEDSKFVATEVAMKRAGYDVTERGDGAQVVRLAPNAPAQGKLNAGDVIMKAEGADIHFAGDVTKAIGSAAPGSNVALQVRSTKGDVRNVDVVATPRPDNAKASYLGIVVQTLNPHLDTPFPVNVDLGKVGGPSAGLAITLAMIDELTPGELTGGKDIAVTGTIKPDGTVGPVGGVKQKISAVKKYSKAKLFIVPNEEVQDAQRNAGKGVKVVGVANVDQAIDAMVAEGGDRSGIPASPAA